MLHSFEALRADRVIVWVDWYSSGVLWAEIEDSTGSRAQFCIDVRIDSGTRGRLFEGVRHPSKPNAKLVEIGEEVEGNVVALLSSWCDNPVNWYSNGGPYYDDFRVVVIKTMLSIGAYS